MNSDQRKQKIVKIWEGSVRPELFLAQWRGTYAGIHKEPYEEFVPEVADRFFAGHFCHI